MIVETYHHIGQRERYFSRLKKSLKRQGRIAANAVSEEMARAGYALVRG